MIYFPTNWGAKEPQNLPYHRVEILVYHKGFQKYRRSQVGLFSMPGDAEEVDIEYAEEAPGFPRPDHVF